MFIFPRNALKLLAVALCAPALAIAQADPAPIKIAVIEVLSGPFGNTGEAVFRNLQWAVERVNARGGVKLPSGNRPLALQRFDSKGQAEEALSTLKSSIDDGAQFVMQGNSSATALTLIDAINAVTAADVKRVAAEYFVADHANVGWFVADNTATAGRAAVPASVR